MTVEETLEAFHTPLVRIKPFKGAKHYHKGFLTAVEGDTALVKPFNHGGRVERIPKDRIVPWTSQNHQNEKRIAMRVATNYRLTKADLDPQSQTDPDRTITDSLNPRDLTNDWLRRNDDEIELTLWLMLSELGEADRMRLLSHDAGRFLQLFILDRPANFARLVAELNDRAGQPVSEQPLRKVLKKLARRGAHRTAASLFPTMLENQAPVADSAEPDDEQPSPLDATIVEIADEPAPQPVVDSDPAAPSGINSSDLRSALRRVIRDSDRVDQDRRFPLEAAVLGEPQLNDALDALNLDGEVAEVLTIQGINASADDVRQARAELWPVATEPPAPVPAIDVLRAALASGELSADDVLRALLGTPGIANPTQLARRCVNLDLDQFAING